MEPEDQAAEFVLAEPRQRVEELVDRLLGGQVLPGTTRVRMAQQMPLGGGSLDRTITLLRAWRTEDGAERLARTLLSQLRIADRIREDSTETELVWTGRKPPGSPLRNTLPVVSEMLDGAQRTVVVLAYSIWLGQAKAGSVLTRLVRAASAGASVMFVVDRRYRTQHGPPGHNLRELTGRWPVGAPKPAVYSWDDEEDEIAKLHAKVLVVDRRDLLVTSANLTGHGVEGNLELGTRTSGRPAERAHDHVMDLVSEGFFRREELW